MYRLTHAFSLHAVGFLFLWNFSLKPYWFLVMLMNKVGKLTGFFTLFYMVKVVGLQRKIWLKQIMSFHFFAWLVFVFVLFSAQDFCFLYFSFREHSFVLSSLLCFVFCKKLACVHIYKWILDFLFFSITNSWSKYVHSICSLIRDLN